MNCAGNNQLTLTQSSQYQPSWNTGSTVNSLNVGAGTYSARIRDAQNKVLFPPAVVVPAVVQPIAPTINTPDGTTDICLSSGLALTSSYAGQNYWSTGSDASSIVVTKPGTYSVRAENVIYGCLSAPGSKTIGLATTELSLFLRSSRRVVSLNDTVTYQITVKNNSNCDAGLVILENQMPPNVTIVSTDPSLSIGDAYGNKMIYSMINQVPANQSVNAKYVARITADGTYVSAAELVATTNPQRSGIPGNGTENGEVDEAHADLRTMTSSNNRFLSPNPLQEALPSVRLNQPQPNTNEADLSLSMRSNSRVITVGNTVTVTLTVTNRGALTATNVGVMDLLPAGMQFLNSSSGMSVNGNTVNGLIAQIPSGQSVSLEFTAQMINVGEFINQAQISSSGQPDSDSTPNNGYSNGEDDRASIGLRGVQ